MIDKKELKEWDEDIQSHVMIKQYNRKQSQGSNLAYCKSDFCKGFGLLLVSLLILLLFFLIPREQFQDQTDFQVKKNHKQRTQQNILQSFFDSPIFEKESKFTSPFSKSQLKQAKQCMNTNKILHSVQKKIQAYSTVNKVICTNIQQRFEYFNTETETFFMMSAYNIFLVSCENQQLQLIVSRGNLLNWNHDRARIQWAIGNAKAGDRILLNHNSNFNMLEIIALAKIIGENGYVEVITRYPRSKCIHKNLLANGVKNVQFITQSDQSRRLKNMADYYLRFTILMEDESLLSQPLIQQIFVRKPSIKLFLFIKNHKKIINLAQILSITQYIVDPNSCNDPIKVNQLTKDKAYYQIMSKSQELTTSNSSNIKSQFNQAQIVLGGEKYLMTNLLLFFQEYQSFKKSKFDNLVERKKKIDNIQASCLCFDREKTERSQFSTVSVYGNYLYNISVEQVRRWETKREAVEWVRAKVEKQGVVYYQLKDLNLLAIVAIADILIEGKLLVYCQGNQCDWIDRQRKFEGIKNIELILDINKQSSSAVQSDAIISDDENLIDKVIEDGYLQKGKLLGFFTRDRNTSLATFAQLLPTHKLEQIQIPFNLEECQGFTYQNYFWDIDELNNFFEISKSQFHIFVYWGGSPKQLTASRRNSLEQIMERSQVQIKPFNKQLFILATSGKKYIKIHQAFKYLSDVHQSDYFRIYAIHNFGGGYSDIKHIHFDWRPYFKKLYDDPQKYAIGCPEKIQADVGCDDEDNELPPCIEIKQNFHHLLSNGMYIYKKDTPLTKNIFERVTRKLDKKLSRLKMHPSKSPRDTIEISNYPLRWAEIGGQQIARAAYQHRDRYLFDMPAVIILDYQ